MSRRKGFTLIELLVVIAIIALLMSILMPTLGKARKMAKASMCMSNLKQWGSFFAMYTDDYNGKFMGGRTNLDNWWSGSWWYVMESYYKDRKLLCCPMATDPKKVSWVEGHGNFGTWGDDWFPYGFYGSYGMNEWVNNPEGQSVVYPTSPEGLTKFWRSTNVRGQATIPLLGDALWDQGWPDVKDLPPIYPGWVEFFAGEDMAQWALLRHDGYINMLFMDYTVKKIHIMDLWGLNWHRLSSQESDQAPTNDDFPIWMQKL